MTILDFFLCTEKKVEYVLYITEFTARLLYLFIKVISNLIFEHEHLHILCLYLHTGTWS